MYPPSIAVRMFGDPFSEFTQANVLAEAVRSMAPVVNAEAPAVIAAFQQMRQSHFIA